MGAWVRRAAAINPEAISALCPAWAYRKRRFDAERCREGLRTLKAVDFKFLSCQNKRAIVSDIRLLWRK